MELRTYEVFFQLNQGFEQVITALGELQRLGAQSPECVTRIRDRVKEFRADANYQLCAGIGEKEDEEAHYFFNLRFDREESEKNPDQIYIDLAVRERQRWESGLPPRVVILPWSKAADDAALARIAALRSPTPPQEVKTLERLDIDPAVDQNEEPNIPDPEPI